MQTLTEEETHVIFEKTVKCIRLLAERLNGTYCSRLHKDQVYYVSEKILKLVPISDFPGTCFRKFTKTHKFQLHITALDYPAPYAKYKVWIKPGAEQSFPYGNDMLKSGLRQIMKNTSGQEVVVADITLGFGMAVTSVQDCTKGDPTFVVFLQANMGEYVWHKKTLT
uniref:60S ribosome subunit biogenesis protein NIP7 homolog n=1 Tax=Chlorocebus sabaeus TaxID=60711 RepID=A0A0D9RT51_CHLSB